MKTILLATAATFVLSSSAFAEGLLGGLGGSAQVEYSVENSTFSMEAGPDLSMGSVMISPRVYSSIDSNQTIGFDGVGVEAVYGINKNMSVYGAVQANGDIEYEDAQVGVRFNF
jgi:hypothetical protein